MSEPLWALPQTLEGESSPCQPAPVCRRLQVQGGVEAEPREAMHHLVTTAGKDFSIVRYRQIKKSTWEAIPIEDCTSQYIMCSEIWFLKSFNPPHMVLTPSRLCTGSI